MLGWIWISLWLVLMNVKTFGDKEGDIVLWLAYCQGHNEALARLIQRHKSRLIATASTYFRGQERSYGEEDAIMEVYLELSQKSIEQKKKMENVEKPFAYLKTAVRNKAYSLMNRDNRSDLFEEGQEEKPSISGAAIKLNFSEEEWHALFDRAGIKRDTLERQIMELSFIEDLSVKEIAEELGIPASKVTSNKYNAMKKLRNLNLDDLNDLFF